MTSNSLGRLAEQIAGLRARVDRVARSPQLANSSIENANLKVKDAAGATTLIIGQQFDGTAVAATVNGPTPPTPNAADVTGLTGGYQVTWDGTFVDPQAGWDSPVVAPMDFARVDVHVSPTSGFTPDATTKMGEIVGNGGTVTISSTTVSANSTRYFKLVAVSAAGKSSAASAQASVTHAGAATVQQILDLHTRIDNLKATDIHSNGVDGAQNGTAILQNDLQYLWVNRNVP